MKTRTFIFGFGLLTLLTACPIGGYPGENLGPGFILSTCSTSRGRFETPTACRLFDAANASAQVTDGSSVTVVLPDETSMTNYLSQQGVTETQFMASAQLLPFVRKHLLRGSPVPGTTQMSLTGETYTIGGTRPAITVGGKAANELAAISEYTFVRLSGTL